MTYDQLCHEIRNLIQIAESTVLAGMKKRRDLRIALKENDGRPPGVIREIVKQYLIQQADNDTDLLLRMRRVERILNQLRKDHGVCDIEIRPY